MKREQKLGASAILAQEGDRQVFKCLNCGKTICSVEENLTKHLLFIEDSAVEHYAKMGIRILDRESPRIVVRHYFCPHCKVSMRMEAFPEGYQYPEDVIKLAV